MEHRISDLLENFSDDRVELDDPRVTSARRVKAMTMERLGLAPAKKTRRRWSRTLLIAAAAMVLLGASALAVYTMSLSDRALDLSHGEDVAGEAIVQYSAAAPLSHTPEYMAEAELMAYLDSFTEARDATRLLPLDHYARRLYGLGYDFFAEKLEELADKYGLRLLQAAAYRQSAEELYALLGTEAFLPAAEDDCTASVYDDGSFEVNLRLALPGGGDGNLNLYRAARGSFTDFYLLGDAPETYVCESYATQTGLRLDLAWSEDDALIFAELDSCYITAELGYNPVGAEPADFGMEGLKAIADSIDFAALDALDTDAIAARVTREYDQTWADYRAAETTPSEKAKAVLEELGHYSLSAVPADLTRHSSEIWGYEDSADSLWTHQHPGGSHAEVILGWEPDGETITNYVYFNYIRYRADEAGTVSCVRESFEEEKAEREAQGFAEMEELTVNGCEGYYFRDVESNSNSLALIWLDEEADLEFRLHLPGSWALEDALTLAQSMVRLN